MIVSLGLATAVVISAAASGYATYRWPRLFWPVVVISAIVGAGPKIFGYAIFDEAILVSSMCGIILKSVYSRDFTIHAPIISTVHSYLFIVLVLFFSFKCVEGIFYLHDWRVIRYLIYFLSLFIAMNFLSISNVNYLERDKFTIIILVAAILYMFVYVSQGAIAEYMKGPLERFSTQGQYFSGSAYATFPLVLVTPIALRLFRQHPLLAGSYLALAIVTALYFHSRIALAVILLFSAIGLRPRIWGHILFLAGLAGSTFAVYDPASAMKIVDTGQLHLRTLTESALFLFSPRASDVDRQVAVLASIHTAWSDPLALLFGQGYYSHRLAMLPAFHAISPFEHTAPIRTTGIAALLVDTGLVGVLLMAANFFLTAVEILHGRFRKKYDFWLPLIGILAFVFAWLFVSNILDMVLLFLLIMPRGLLVRLQEQLSQPPPTPRSRA